MAFGRHLRELMRLRVGVIASTLLATLAAIWSVADISVSPPKLTSRSMEMGTAFTQVVVDTPNSAILDLRQETYDIDSLKNRAVLVGNVMASPPVRGYIARRAHVPDEALQIVTPRTPAEPRARAELGSKKGPGDILESTDQYRLDIQANPTVPVLDVYAQAPTAKASEELANAAVDGLGDYLRELAGSERTPAEMQARLRQLGRAHGEVINDGVKLQVAVVVFLLVFAISSAAVVVVSRVRRGWVAAEAAGWSS
jgi:hypothetical protein